MYCFSQHDNLEWGRYDIIRLFVVNPIPLTLEFERDQIATLDILLVSIAELYHREPAIV